MSDNFANSLLADIPNERPESKELRKCIKHDKSVLNKLGWPQSKIDQYCGIIFQMMMMDCQKDEISVLSK